YIATSTCPTFNMTHPIQMTPILELRDFDITTSQICFDMVTMESDRFIACRDKAMNSTSVTVIDLENSKEPLELPIPADSAIMHPRRKIVAVRHGKMLQLIDIEQDKMVKSHNNHEVVIYWRWIDEGTIGFVTHDTTVFHWALDDHSAPVKKFTVDHKIKERCRIVDYRADKYHKFLALIGIAKNSRGGEGGSIQLYCTESGQSRFFDGNAACFVKMHLESNSEPSNLLVYSSNKGESMLKVQMLWSHEAGDQINCKPPSSLIYPSESDSDYPISINSSSREGAVYLVTKRGFFYIFYLDPSMLIYSGRILEDFIYIATRHFPEGVIGITMKGQVFSISMSFRKMVKFVSDSNRDLARKINEKWMWPILPSAPFLQPPEKEVERIHWRGGMKHESHLTDSITQVLVAGGQDPSKIRKKDIQFIYDFVEKYKLEHMQEAALPTAESPSPRSISPIDESIPSSSSYNPFLQDLPCTSTTPILESPSHSKPLPPLPPVPPPRPSLAKTEKKSSEAELLARAEKAERERDALAARLEDIERKYRKALDLLARSKVANGTDEKTSLQEFVRNACKIGIQGLLAEFSQMRLETHPIGDKPRIAFHSNPDKNRYLDVYCVDESRVVLNDGGSDYINANWVEVSDSQRRYICTQAPMTSTIEDFWRMVWQTKCRSIVMLCNIMECGKKKCEQYWPDTVGQEVAFGSFRLRALTKEQEQPLTITLLSISSGFETFEIEHILWSDWPDRGVPMESLTCFKLLEKIKNLTPTAIHCSAGIGRTGTIVALDLLSTSLQKGETKTAKEIVVDLRTKRHGSVQTDLQYLFIHRAVIEYGLSKQMLEDSEVRVFINDYDALCDLRGCF
ncbi:hypothetical protein PMAYCL1PPCAC_11507, partial [Pristionchus mayeri]